MLLKHDAAHLAHRKVSLRNERVLVPKPLAGPND